MNDSTWLAQRHGQDWRDAQVCAALDWLTWLSPSDDLDRRIRELDGRFKAACRTQAPILTSSTFHDGDVIAWYMHQARCYSDPALRPEFFEPEGFRIAPLFKRLGQLLPELRQVRGADDRAARLMLEGRSQPDDIIYELLVAAAYKKRGWTDVAFVAEKAGVEQQPDMHVSRGSEGWAVECKRAGRSDYAKAEWAAGRRMAFLAHEVSRAAGRPILVIVRFDEELMCLPDDYLAQKVGRFLGSRRSTLEWEDEGGAGGMMEADLGPLQQVLMEDDVLFGSSRMAQLLLGRYESAMDFDLAGDWVPANGRPFHATWVEHASIVAWKSASVEAARRKAQHFRGLVGRASRQLPGDRPGAIHVGYEAINGNMADGRRHELNREQMRSFDAGGSGLRIVYGNYFMPEHVTARLESAAVTETMAWYPVGSPDVEHPLPGHMLFMDEDGRPGTHFVR